MTYGELLKYQELINKIDEGNFNDDASKVLDAIILVDEYKNTLKPYNEAMQKWAEDNKAFSEKWNEFIQDNMSELRENKNVVIPEFLREGKAKMDRFNLELASKEVENFNPRVLFSSLEEWKKFAGNLIPSEIREAKSFGILKVE
jgi:uncharacterized protein YeaO (DUF488 family)